MKVINRRREKRYLDELKRQSEEARAVKEAAKARKLARREQRKQAIGKMEEVARIRRT